MSCGSNEIISNSIVKTLPRPKAVIFDLGKVLLDFDYGIVIRGIAKRSVISLEDLRTLIDQSPLLYRYETGLMSTLEFYEAIRTATGFEGSLDDFSGIFGDIFTEIDPMIRLNLNLRLAGIPTFIFSNTNELAVRHIRSTYPFFKNFNGFILSYEHKSMKPAEAIYEAVEQATGLQGHALLYIDDRLENVDAGVRRGWQVIHHLAAHQTIEEVSKRLLIGHVMM